MTSRDGADIDKELDKEKELKIYCRVNPTTHLLPKRKGRDSYKLIIDLLNKVAGKRYRPTTPKQKDIKARWNEGFRFEDFKHVILVKLRNGSMILL